ncbi:uridine kinase [Lyticum sinuosum]|uniref:Uridine kinase n=1 Tax=Lyticum sinuosum TaxID=1332059 RepID=A0AAE4VL49_9RICK|nr:uridine kinase [Lyticum sinuosum]MDZ5761399.1 Uridine kinase [Lyticum sinuosum]
MTIKKNLVVVGIAGASGSGKSSLANAIMKDIPEVVIIPQDNYYFDLSYVPFMERRLRNFDHPRSIDNELLVQHIKDLKMGKTIFMPQYDHKTCTRHASGIEISKCKVIVIEGIMVLSDKNLRKMLDIKIFVDTPLDLCLSRRLQRDVVERGLKIEDGIKMYNTKTRPMFMKFVKTSRKYAHFLIPKGGRNKVAIDIVRNMLIKLVDENNVF